MLLRLQDLPDEALEAAATFHGSILPFLETMLSQSSGVLTIALNPADHTHRDWRVAAVRQLARKHAPNRVNLVAAASEAALVAADRYLEGAEGVTGQYLPLDDAGAGPVLDAIQ
jgi:hypothetical protein